MAKESTNSTQTTDTSDLKVKTIRLSADAQRYQAVVSLIAAEMPDILRFLTNAGTVSHPQFLAELNSSMTQIEIESENNNQISMTVLDGIFAQLA